MNSMNSQFDTENFVGATNQQMYYGASEPTNQWGMNEYVGGPQQQQNPMQQMQKIQSKNQKEFIGAAQKQIPAGYGMNDQQEFIGSTQQQYQGFGMDDQQMPQMHYHEMVGAEEPMGLMGPQSPDSFRTWGKKKKKKTSLHTSSPVNVIYYGDKVHGGGYGGGYSSGHGGGYGSGYGGGYGKGSGYVKGYGGPYGGGYYGGGYGGGYGGPHGGPHGGPYGGYSHGYGHGHGHGGGYRSLSDCEDDDSDEHVASTAMDNQQQLSYNYQANPMVSKFL